MIDAQKLGDKTAIGLSLLCLVHCLALPVIFMLLPTFAGITFFTDESFHRWMLYAVIPVSSAALLIGYSHHKKLQTLLIGLLGIIILVVAVSLGHDILGRMGEVVLTVAGSLAMTLGHIVNYRLSSRHKMKL